MNNVRRIESVRRAAGHSPALAIPWGRHL